MRRGAVHQRGARAGPAAAEPRNLPVRLLDLGCIRSAEIREAMVPDGSAEMLRAG